MPRLIITIPTISGTSVGDSIPTRSVLGYVSRNSIHVEKMSRSPFNLVIRAGNIESEIHTHNIISLPTITID